MTAPSKITSVHENIGQLRERYVAAKMSEEIEKHVLKKYEVAQKLGKGVRYKCSALSRFSASLMCFFPMQAYGVVWKAVDRRSRHTVALKKCYDAFRNSTDAQRTFREIMYLQELAGCDHIVRLLNVVRAENDKDIYLVFEYMGE